MYCVDKCLNPKLCRNTQAAGAMKMRGEDVMAAVEQLHRAVASTNASLDNCFVFTLENRNSLMHRIAEVKAQANVFGCAYLLELCALAEIITMVLFRSHHYRDRQGLEQIEQAVQQMQFCCAAKADSQGHVNRVTDTVERLWRWVDMNTLPGIQPTPLQTQPR